MHVEVEGIGNDEEEVIIKLIDDHRISNSQNKDQSKGTFSTKTSGSYGREDSMPRRIVTGNLEVQRN